jgi:hypothetical protein
MKNIFNLLLFVGLSLPLFSCTKSDNTSSGESEADRAKVTAPGPNQIEDQAPIVSPTEVVGFENVSENGITSLGLGSIHGCYSTRAGKVRCFGVDLWTSRPEAQVPVDLGKTQKIVAGGSFTCALLVDASIRCWGGFPAQPFASPTNPAKFLKMSAAGSVLCAVSDQGQVLCYGASGTVPEVLTPPAWLGKVTDVSVDGFSACALQEDSEMICWGKYLSNLAPKKPGDLNGVVKLALKGMPCGITANHEVKCITQSWQGMTIVTKAEVVKREVVNLDSAYAIKLDGTIDYRGSLLSQPDDWQPPSNLRNVTAVDGNQNNGACAGTSQGEVICWGGYKLTPPQRFEKFNVFISRLNHCVIDDQSHGSCGGWNVSMPWLGVTDVKFAFMGDSTQCFVSTDNKAKCYMKNGKVWHWDFFNKTTKNIIDFVAVQSENSSGLQFDFCALFEDASAECGADSPTFFIKNEKLVSVAVDGYGEIYSVSAAGSLYKHKFGTMTKIKDGSVVKVSAGKNFYCTLSSSGQVVCEGTTPKDYLKENIKDLSCGGNHCCVLGQNSAASCWYTDHPERPSWGPVPSVYKIKSGGNRAVFLKDDGVLQFLSF